MIEKDIKSYFEGVLENIDIILDNSFYKTEDKDGLKYVKSKIKEWYKIYMKKNTLKGIDPNELKKIDLEITDFFDKYIATESVRENYAERLLFDLGQLEMKWKDEMLGGNL